VVVKSGDRLDIVMLALALGADRAATIDRLQRASRLLGSRTDRKGVADEDGRYPPGGDGARRVVVERFAEGLLALGVGGLERRSGRSRLCGD